MLSITGLVRLPNGADVTDMLTASGTVPDGCRRRNDRGVDLALWVQPGVDQRKVREGRRHSRSSHRGAASLMEYAKGSMEND